MPKCARCLQEKLLVLRATKLCTDCTQNSKQSFATEEIRTILQDIWEEIERDEFGFAKEAPHYIPGALNTLNDVARRFGIGFYTTGDKTEARIK